LIELFRRHRHLQCRRIGYEDQTNTPKESYMSWGLAQAFCTGNLKMKAPNIESAVGSCVKNQICSIFPEQSYLARKVWSRLSILTRILSKASS